MNDEHLHEFIAQMYTEEQERLIDKIRCIDCEKLRKLYLDSTMMCNAHKERGHVKDKGKIDILREAKRIARDLNLKRKT